MKHTLIVAAVVAGMGMTASPASARLAINTIETDATYSRGESLVRIGGPIQLSLIHI